MALMSLPFSHQLVAWPYRPFGTAWQPVRFLRVGWSLREGRMTASRDVSNRLVACNSETAADGDNDESSAEPLAAR